MTHEEALLEAQRHLTVTVTPAALNSAWKKYAALFGEDPHGTIPQMAALLELCGRIEADVTIPVPVAQLIYNVFLPANHKRMRSATPEVIEAVKVFKALVEAAFADADKRTEVRS
jgi:hypothetical protein